jgi:hypothetical protein
MEIIREVRHTSSLRHLLAVRGRLAALGRDAGEGDERDGGGGKDHVAVLAGTGGLFLSGVEWVDRRGCCVDVKRIVERNFGTRDESESLYTSYTCLCTKMVSRQSGGIGRDTPQGKALSHLLATLPSTTLTPAIPPCESVKALAVSDKRQAPRKKRQWQVQARCMIDAKRGEVLMSGSTGGRVHQWPV